MKQLIIFLCLFTSLLTSAQNNEVRVAISGLKSGVMTLGYYQGDQMFRADSLPFDSSTQEVVFNRKPLPPGMYFIAVRDGRLFDFMVEKSGAACNIRGALARLDSLTAEDSPENTAFFGFQTFKLHWSANLKQLTENAEMLRRATKNDAEVMRTYDDKIAEKYAEYNRYIAQYRADYPQFLHTKMIAAITPPDPDPAITDPEKVRAYMRQHFWDNADFANEALLINNYWTQIFDYYLFRMLPPHPDSIASGIDALIAKMPTHGAFYRYAVMHCTQLFENNNAPGADRLFVHMVDQFQKPGTTPWLDEATLLRLEDKANSHRPNLTGNKAPDLLLEDDNGQSVQLSKMDDPAYMLLFYSPLCSHCREAMPEIYRTFLQYEPMGLKAIAINTDDKFEHWKEFAKNQNMVWLDAADPTGKNDFVKTYSAYNLPVIYLLNKDKIILQKRVKLEDLNSALGRLMNRQ